MTTAAPDWSQLLSAKRSRATVSNEPFRSAFQRDYDRIVFSAAFRRLQDKTQVHPFPESDYIRRRLTHSLEVSCVGRSLGTALGHHLTSLLSVTLPDLPFTIGQIVANACLAHDIGNPPFGHAGEMAIGSWFQHNLPSKLVTELTEAQRADLDRFEGNAQGFRLLTRLLDGRGLHLTFATLAAFTKYPTASTKVCRKAYIGAKKHGFFEEDAGHFAEVAATTGLIPYEHGWRRHPLVFLVEAADDICYRIIDVEDACKLNRFTFEQAEGLLVDILPSSGGYRRQSDEDENINWLRAKTIGVLIEQVNEFFIAHLPDILSGKFSSPLVEGIPSHASVKSAHDAVVGRVFKWERTLSAEIAGAQMITDVLERLIEAIVNPAPYKNQKLLGLIPKFQQEATTYSKILSVTDFIAGMTDTYLQRIHRRISGQSIH